MIFRPSRKLRREVDGRPCVACANRLHFADVVCISGDEGTVYIHESCANMLVERMPETDTTDDAQQQLPGFEG